MRPPRKGLGAKPAAATRRARIPRLRRPPAPPRQARGAGSGLSLADLQDGRQVILRPAGSCLTEVLRLVQAALAIRSPCHLYISVHLQSQHKHRAHARRKHMTPRCRAGEMPPLSTGRDLSQLKRDVTPVGAHRLWRLRPEQRREARSPPGSVHTASPKLAASLAKTQYECDICWGDERRVPRKDLM
eukprot:CAMPEP_0113262506 /NCGR_PEP_ID=MMETSP0008_2-20120614/17960_1 /TAXON_ID=97485 /ORGANISM="Prymnesium parvum" /LENGTH=186 /DNA_ID=CAMNT_0000111173 /DNA_START=1 /DNA_END=561 /DNA_ORIENTATION=- /assembly_acc=CAM_ASM_000153